MPYFEPVNSFRPRTPADAAAVVFEVKLPVKVSRLGAEQFKFVTLLVLFRSRTHVDLSVLNDIGWTFETVWRRRLGGPAASTGRERYASSDNLMVFKSLIWWQVRPAGVVARFLLESRRVPGR